MTAATVEPSANPQLDRPSVWKLLAALTPFIISGVLILATNVRVEVSVSVWVGLLLLLGLGLCLLLVVVAGLVRGLPRWAMPSLGLVLALLLYLFLAAGGDLLPQVTARLIAWPSSNLGRVISQTARSLVTLLPIVLLCAVLLAVSAWLPPLRPWYRRVRQDWSLLSYLFYPLAIITILIQDAYKGLVPYQIGGLAILGCGAWAYLRMVRPWSRLLMLLAALGLSLGLLALGIYWLYPQQEWAAHTTFPRWWEALNPLMNGVALAVFLVAPAVLSQAGPEGPQDL